MIFHADGNQIRSAILISDKIQFKSKISIRNKDIIL